MGSAIRPFLMAISLSFALASLSCKRSAIVPPLCNTHEKHEPVHNAHCNCSKSKHLQPAPQTLLRHSSPVSSLSLPLSQAVGDPSLNQQQSQIHQNSVPQTAHYPQHHSKKTATSAATSAHHQKAKAQGKAKAKESVYSASTAQTATRVYATRYYQPLSQLLDHEQTASPTQLLLVLGHGPVMARRNCGRRDVRMFHRVHHVLVLFHSLDFGFGLSQRMDLEDRPCLPRRAEDVLPPLIQRGRNFSNTLSLQFLVSHGCFQSTVYSFQV